MRGGRALAFFRKFLGTNQPATYVQATPDLMMGDLLKNMRSSEIFSVCGLPEIRINHYQLEVGSMVIWLEAGSQAKAPSPTECG